MDEHVISLFKDYEQSAEAPEDIVAKYKTKLPQELLSVWQQYGFGSLLNGYLRMVNPDDYQDILDMTYLTEVVAIPVFVTAFADMIIWQNDKFLKLLKYKNSYSKVIAAGFRFFWGDLEDGDFDELFDRERYEEAIARYGKLAFDESFGYVPLLALGGGDNVEHLDKVKTREHIAIMTSFMGEIE